MPPAPPDPLPGDEIQHWSAFGEAPTRVELGKAMGITPVSAHLLVGKLARDGLVVVAPRKHRNVEVA